MKYTRVIKIPETTRDVIDYVTCDLCKAKIASTNYGVNEVTIKHKFGDNYPECGNGIETSVDLCSDCFDNKLVPWFRSQGVQPHIEDWEW